MVDADFSVSVTPSVTVKGNSAVLRCAVHPSPAPAHIRVTSWLHEEGQAIQIGHEREPRGKYTLLNDGNLLVHHTSTYDSYKRYVCKAENRLTGVQRRSHAEAKLTLTGITFLTRP